MISVPLEKTRAEAARWAKEYRAAFPVVFDPGMKIAGDYEVESIPHTVAIGTDGRVQRIIVGADVNELDAAVRRLVASQ